MGKRLQGMIIGVVVGTIFGGVATWAATLPPSPVDSAGVVHACVSAKDRVYRVPIRTTQTCGSTERPVSWGQGGDGQVFATATFGLTNQGCSSNEYRTVVVGSTGATLPWSMFPCAVVNYNAFNNPPNLNTLIGLGAQLDMSTLPDGVRVDAASGPNTFSYGPIVHAGGHLEAMNCDVTLAPDSGQLVLYCHWDFESPSLSAAYARAAVGASAPITSVPLIFRSTPQQVVG